MTHEAVLHIFGGVVSKDPEKLRHIKSDDGIFEMHAGIISETDSYHEEYCDDGKKICAAGKFVEGIMLMHTAESGIMSVKKQSPSVIDGIEQVEHLIVFKPASQCKLIVCDPFKNYPYVGFLEEDTEIMTLPCLYLNEQTFSKQ